MSYLNDYIKVFKESIDNTEFYIFDNKVDKEEFFTALLKDLNKKNNIVKDSMHSSNRVYLIGNGASCSMASHFATDITKNIGMHAESLNDGAALTCFSNDYSFEDSYAEMLKRKLKYFDILIAISSSGNSKNILRAVEYARGAWGNIVITLSGFKKYNALMNIGVYNIYCPTKTYGFTESLHAFWLHMLIDLWSNNGI